MRYRIQLINDIFTSIKAPFSLQSTLVQRTENHPTENIFLPNRRASLTRSKTMSEKYQRESIRNSHSRSKLRIPE